MAPMISKATSLKLPLFLSILLILVVALSVSVSSSKAALATKGETFVTNYFEIPAGSVPSGPSGESDGHLVSSPVSSNGRYTFFVSQFNFAGGNQPGYKFFRRDNQTGSLVLASRANGADGASAGNIAEAKTDASGNLLSFATEKSLTPADADEEYDVYLRNISANTTTLITPEVTTGTAFSIDLSANGNFLSFSTDQSLVAGDTNGAPDIYRRNLTNGTIDLVSRVSASVTSGNGGSYQASISNDGRWVAFDSQATDLVAGFVSNNGGSSDVFVRDITSGTTSLVSSRYNSSLQGSNGESGSPDISGTPVILADVAVAYNSSSTNLADNGVIDPDSDSSVYVKDFPATASELISRATGGASANSRAHDPSISDNGNIVIFSTDATNLGPPPDYYGVYSRNRISSTTELVSRSTKYAVQGEVSGDGNTASWFEDTDKAIDGDAMRGVFIRTLPSGPIQLVSRPEGSQKIAAVGFYAGNIGSQNVLSSDSRYVVLSGSAERYSGTESSQVFRRDLMTGSIEVASRKTGAAGELAGYSEGGSISNDGNTIAFLTSSSLVPADTNGEDDVYVRDLIAKTTELASANDLGVVGDLASGGGYISGDGKSVVFMSNSSNLGGPGAQNNVYVRDLVANKTYLVSRATGIAGVAADSASYSPAISTDGKRVVFQSYASNLDPADADTNAGIFVRDLGTNTTTLVSRTPGLAGTSLPTDSDDPMISGDGKVVTFGTNSEEAVPTTAPWPISRYQIVSRNIASGANTLISEKNGVVGNNDSFEPTMDSTGSTIAFATNSDNLRSDALESSQVVVRNLATNETSLPPTFGRQSARPVLNSTGNCLATYSYGFNSVEPLFADLPSLYIYVNNSTCYNPRKTDPIPPPPPVVTKPTLKGVAVSPKAISKKARSKRKKAVKISFNINKKATVSVVVSKKTLKRTKACKKKRKKPAKCFFYKTKVKASKTPLGNGGKGNIVLKKKFTYGLKKGVYRVQVQASNSAGKSKKIFRSLKVKR